MPTTPRVLPNPQSADPLPRHRHDPDPRLLTEEPPEPFSQLMPGAVIEPGDITKPLGEDKDWKTVSPKEVGQKVPDVGNAVARLKMPEGYVAVGDRDKIGPRDLVWRTSCQSWEPVMEPWVGHDPLRAIYRGPNEEIYVCRPTFEPCNARELGMPANHRELAVGERVRRGDKMIHVGMDGWQTVSERYRGIDVLECAEANGWSRYCRPIHPQSQVWWVDPTVKEGGMGGYEDPFRDLESATKAIEKAAESMNRAPHGVIRAKSNGTPVLAYDLPEPPAAANQRAQRVFEHTLPTPEGFKKLAPTDEVRHGDQVERDGIWEAADAFNGIEVGQLNVIRKKGAARGAAVAPKELPLESRQPSTPVEKEKNSIGWIAEQLGQPPLDLVKEMDKVVPEGWRRLDYCEEMRDGDALIGLVKSTGMLTLGDVPDTLMGQEANDFYVIRKRLVGTTEDVAQRIELLERRVEAILEEIQELKKDLQ